MPLKSAVAAPLPASRSHSTSKYSSTPCDLPLRHPRIRAPDSVLTATAPRCLSHAVIFLFGYVVSSTRRLAEWLRLKSSCSLRHEHVDMSDEFNPSNPNPRHSRDPASCTCNGVSCANGLHAWSCAVVTSGRDFARPLLPCCP